MSDQTGHDDLYPPAPSDVPADLCAPGPAYRRHAWIALISLCAFALLYLGLTGWFGWNALRLLRGALRFGSNGGTAWVLAVSSTLLFLFLARGMLAVKRNSSEGLVEIDEAEEPGLVAFVNRVADDAGAPRPHRIYLSSDVNAAVFADLSVRNLLLPARKNLIVGLGLVNCLTVDEFKAVIAHEFGHFAQRTTAVGRWVYVGQQVASHVVGHRGALDQLLGVLSRIDLRVAWIGWIGRLIIWSLRSVLELAFRGILLAERALSREMEFQADLVSVSLCGSDSLVHALHKLGPADEALNRAGGFCAGAEGKQRPVRDLYTIQNHLAARMARLRSEPPPDVLPTPPAAGAADHRVFSHSIAQPPRMWSTHPPNRDREDNAKRTYLPSPRDERSCWSLFSDPEARREALTKLALGRELEAETQPPEESLADLDELFDRPYLDERYRGAWFGRPVTLDAADPADLVGPLPEGHEAIAAALQALYPEELTEQLARWRELGEEHDLLVALQDGVLTAPGGVLRHRGEELPRAELPTVLARVGAERQEAHDVLLAHSRRCRAAHRAAARALDPAWHDALAGLTGLLHYAEHTLADLDDAMGHLANTVAVVTADGNVSSRERKRLVASAGDVEGALIAIWGARQQVVFPDPVAAALETDTLAGLLPDAFDLPSVTTQNVGPWLDVAQSWADGFRGTLSTLLSAARDALLQAEDRVRAAFEGGEPLGPAPSPGATPSDYRTLPPGSEREIQKRLGLWDRFVLADGTGPTILKLAVALAILLPTLFFAQETGDTELNLYNGFSTPVVVYVNGAARYVSPHKSLNMKTPSGEPVELDARLQGGGPIEQLSAELEGFDVRYVYNIAGAGTLMRYTISYGEATERPPIPIARAGVFAPGVDYLFEIPPEQIRLSGGGAVRTLLESADDLPVPTRVRLLAGSADQQRVISVHLQHEPIDGEEFLMWAYLATDKEALAAILEQRRAAEGEHVVLGRLEQDVLDKDAACARHRRLREASPDDADLSYLVTRCLPDGEAQNLAFIEQFQRFPENRWLAFAAAYSLASLDRWADAEAALTLASELPPLAPMDLPLEIARLRRLGAAPGASVDLSDLLRRSEALTLKTSLRDAPQTIAPEARQYWAPYSALARGRLPQALDSAQPDSRAAVLRLVAESTGATPQQRQQRDALGADEGVDWTTVALAAVDQARRGQPTEQILARAEELHGERYAEALAAVLDAEALRRNPAIATRASADLRLAERGQVLLAALLTLGDDAPPAWRDQVQRLLLPGERPYLGTEPI